MESLPVIHSMNGFMMTTITGESAIKDLKRFFGRRHPPIRSQRRDLHGNRHPTRAGDGGGDGPGSGQLAFHDQGCEDDAAEAFAKAAKLKPRDAMEALDAEYAAAQIE